MGSYWAKVSDADLSTTPQTKKYFQLIYDKDLVQDQNVI